MRKFFFVFISIFLSLLISSLNVFWYDYDYIDNKLPINSVTGTTSDIIFQNWTKDVIIKNNENEVRYTPYSSIYWSKNWKHYFFIVKQDWKSFIIKDWEKSKSYDYIDSDFSKMSDDWSSYAFIVEINKTNTWTNYVWNKYVVVKDWIESEIYSRIQELNYFPNSTDIFYFYNNIKYSSGAGNNSSYIPIDVITSAMMINDKKVSKEYTWSIFDAHIIKHMPNTVVFSVMDDYNFYLVFNWKESNKYDKDTYWDNGSYVHDVVVSPNWKSITYSLWRDPEWYYRIIKDDVEIWRFMNISNIRYSSDSKNILYDVERYTFSDRLNNIFAVFSDKSFHKFSMENWVEKWRIKDYWDTFIDDILNNDLFLWWLLLMLLLALIYQYRKKKKFPLFIKVIFFSCVAYLIFNRWIMLLIWLKIIEIHIGL